MYTDANKDKLISRITFNTGRLYTAEGQVITAELYAGGKVVFDDSSRMIWGEFQVEEVELTTKWWPSHKDDFARGVMCRYDAGNYSMGRGGLVREATILQQKI